MKNLTTQKTTGRSGVTLLEILICIGILAVGLLGVVSLIPVGHFAVVETTKADRSTACAKAAKAQVQIRGMLKAESWAGYVPNGNTIVLDPLGVASGATGSFPPTGSVTLGRLTTQALDNMNDLTGTPLAPNEYRMLNERVCLWADDVVIDVDDSDPDTRPRQMFVFRSGSMAPCPQRTTDTNYPTDTDPTDTPFVQSTKGEYSWFLTVTPSVTEAASATAPEDLKTFEVSTVVCYARGMDFVGTPAVPEERAVGVDGSFSGISGAGASDVPLVWTTGTTEEKLEYLNVKPGQWMMLVGYIPDTRFTSGFRTARWYRVLTVDDEMDSTGNIRWITVTGPEWDANVIQNTQAVLVDDVIGVFTETMTVER